MRIFISTGEVSGDLQGSLLITALKRQAVAMGLELEILALGGEKMQQAGAILLGNTSTIGSMGILEGLPYVLPTLQVQRQAIAYLKENPPDLVVLIDYMSPNLAIGTFMQQNLPRVPVVYYIAPQEWAWSLSLRNTNRIVGFTDKLLAIFPEEARYYREQGAEVTWVGHPLVDRMQDAPSRQAARATLGIEPEQIAIALLPASRRQELKYLLPIIFQAAQTIQAKLPEVQFWIPLSLEIYRQPIQEAIKRYGLRATVMSGQQKEIFAAADLAITKSGTVNLELALLNVPQVVVYRLNPMTAWIARKFLKGSITFASPPNLVAMKPIVPEFLQEEATPENIIQAAMELLINPIRRQQTLADYQEMQRNLGEIGVCNRAAQEILAMLSGSGE
ncbi:lipid-A-disaccharide synthase [Nostoc linckia z18]|uniref:Lipid-A-disaccharide synthase n=2 Tax=Nostoc linckia TaxID=92942 RepID=A0A9Q6EMQ1_NOSLI|nr:lipid-A-disaccharide synthase [Nostoc linckia]PHK38614.1 lipid-A-disaccharide synthase [Nostoc linckia z15]PHK47084.1 lipid-A-disaccharide synthase [Nostoc linckia z16]PHJ67572.1 lipid-A-disaccharide synthase [Nostoc linckia z1]PHJ72598.1 lipid-A-disaccharide synthase [Nostoc linckia z3]PHJ73524.1 lipid-A-disaccharide synthase [Nostoc linckia z2]